MQFQLCENTDFFLRLGLVGPSGSGKTYTALAIATGLGFERIGVIDTENRSARRYARNFSRRFESLELGHYSPRDYIEAIRAAEGAGIEVLIIDSLSHAWMGRGGVLEMVDQSAKRQARGGSASSFNGWREVTPEHNRLVDALIQAKLHLIVTMRVKGEYVVETNDKGRAVPRKIGLAPVQRDGLEYEFDVVGEMSMDHDLYIAKTRLPTIADEVINRPGAELAKALRAWLDGAAPEPEQPTPAADSPRVMQRGEAPALDIAPWLGRIAEAEKAGSEEALDATRAEMNTSLKGRLSKVQGETLRRAIETARAAIRAKVPKREEGEATPEEIAAAEAEAQRRARLTGSGNYDDDVGERLDWSSEMATQRSSRDVTQ